MIKIFDSDIEASIATVKVMEQILITFDSPLYCLAAGSTPKLSYQYFYESEQVIKAIEKARFVGLDEWVGVKSTMVGSCYQMMNDDLFRHLPLKENQVHFFHTFGTDLEEECKSTDTILEKQKITFSLMGVGMNGHIGLNEPGMPTLNHSSVVPLSETTKSVAPKYFEQPVRLEQGITLGLQQIIDSEKVIVLLLGKHKAEIAKLVIEGKDQSIPASRLLGYNHIDFYLDVDAASLLTT